MTQEDKDLLLRDLCARLPHKVIVEFVSYECEEKPWFGELSCKDLDCFIHDVGIIEIKPYLFPLSSITYEQIMSSPSSINVCDLENLRDDDDWADLNIRFTDLLDLIDWLLKNHFDIYGLIPKGLAVEVTKENNPYK